MLQVNNLLESFAKVHEFWSPHIVCRINDQYMKIAKLKGSFVWHKHDHEDELFYIVKGTLMMEYEDKTLELHEGDVHVVPRNTLHNPIAEEECWVVLVEPVETKHTGDTVYEGTKSIDDQLADGKNL